MTNYIKYKNKVYDIMRHSDSDNITFTELDEKIKIISRESVYSEYGIATLIYDCMDRDLNWALETVRKYANYRRIEI